MTDDWLLTPEQAEALAKNGEANYPDGALDHVPVVKLFLPGTGCVWLLTELHPNDPDVAFGLCDLGMGFPELGYVRLSELRAMPGPVGFPVKRDESFVADKPISEYSREAAAASRIVT